MLPMLINDIPIRELLNKHAKSCQLNVFGTCDCQDLFGRYLIVYVPEDRTETKYRLKHNKKISDIIHQNQQQVLGAEPVSRMKQQQ